MNFNFSAPFFEITPAGSSNNYTSCSRPIDYAMTTRTTLIGIALFGLGIISISLHSLLLSIIIYRWKAVFCHSFVYKLIINMNIMAIVYSLVTFSAICPCIVFGCLSFPTNLLQIFSGLYRGVEYGVYFVVFFIAIDRLFTFYFENIGLYYRKVSYLSKWS
jgi:hypothetical protein